MLVTAGDVYRVRYKTKTSIIEVLRGPHDDSRFRLGQVVTVKDLTDPQGPLEKTMYVSRFISVEPDSVAPSRYDGDSDDDGTDSLAVGDMVTVDRRELQQRGSKSSRG